MINILQYLPILTTLLILCYIPFVCISDLRTRTFDFNYFWPLIIIGGANLAMYLLESPTRNYWLLALSLILCAILLTASMIGGIGGADFFFASFIMLFVQYNPFKFPRVFFALDFFWTLMLVSICLPIIIYAYNCVEYNPPTTFIGKLTHCPRGVPFMLVISFAFVATLVMEMII